MLINQMQLINYTTVVNALIYQLLTSHYEQRWKYYLLTEGHGDQGFASEEELHLSRKLFWGVFRALEKKVNLIKYLCLSYDHPEIVYNNDYILFLSF